MSDWSRIVRLIQGIQSEVDELADEVAALRRREEVQLGTGRSVGREAALTDRTGLYDLTKVVPPTRTDAPDSIVGGRPTRDFPDCCAVGNDQGFYCTGTLIAPNLVVTARHCQEVTRVFLRGFDVSDLSEGEVLRVAEQYEHSEHDFRVLVLAGRSTAPPRRVARASEVRTERALLVGFGTIDFSGTIGYGVKRAVEVPITSLSCSGDDALRYGCRNGYEFVAGHRGLNRDSCKGDSGGPAYVQSSDGNYELLGATSRGASGGTRTCGDGGIYVRIDRFVDWIFEKTAIRVADSLT